MYLSGLDEKINRGFNGDFAAFNEERVLCRYDHWSKGNRTAKYELLLPEDNKISTAGGGVSASKTTISYTVAGQYIFASVGFDWDGTPSIYVFDKDTAKPVITLHPGPEVGDASGWVDNYNMVYAVKRSTGEYIITQEENWFNKLLIYRWTPGVIWKL